MPPDNRTTLAVLKALGLTGAIGQAVACDTLESVFACLEAAIAERPEDTGDTGEAGDTGDTGDVDAAPDPEHAAIAVLQRGVLPEDVAARLRAHTPSPTGD